MTSRSSIVSLFYQTRQLEVFHVFFPASAILDIWWVAAVQYHCGLIFVCIPVSPFVVDGPVHFTHKRETTIIFIDITQSNSKCTGGLASFIGEVHWLFTP